MIYYNVLSLHVPLRCTTIELSAHYGDVQDHESHIINEPLFTIETYDHGGNVMKTVVYVLFVLTLSTVQVEFGS